MQKVIRRSILAEKQAARRLARRKETHKRTIGKNHREAIEVVRKEVAGDILAERRARREDYELGPLAPRRDVGDDKGTYGAISPSRLQWGMTMSVEERAKVNPSGGRYANIVEGDRVVLLEGKDRGKIGEVTRLHAAKQQVTVKGLNMADVKLPAWFKDVQDGDGRPVRSIEVPISLTAVKLVFPLTDPETGVTRDVIVREVQNGKIFRDRATRTISWKRYIAGLNIVIPWPKKEPREHKDFDGDTLRIDVESKTFVPTLLKPPMPTSVIDELRNKFSVFRTRHDEEYIQKKLQEDAEKQALKDGVRDMRSPVHEANRRDRKLRKELGKGKLSDEMLAKIGEVIARNKGLGDKPATPDAVVV